MPSADGGWFTIFYWVGIVGSSVSIIGFPLAIYQLLRVRRSVEAAREAAGETARRAAIHRAVTLCDEVAKLSHEMTWAAQNRSRKSMVAQLERVIVVCGELAGVLAWLGVNGTPAKAPPELAQLRISASQSLDHLKPFARVRVVTSEARMHGNAAAAECSALAAGLRSEARSELMTGG